jgi:hypothetical protein
MEEKLEFRIFGQVIDQCGQPLAGLQVEAWDKDWRGHWNAAWGDYDDFVGGDVTDEEGAFEIVFDQSHYYDLPYDEWPDIYFKVLREGELIIDTEDDIMWNLPEGETPVDILVDIPEATGKITGLIFYDVSGDVTRQKDDEGPPIQGVEVMLQPTGSNPHQAPEPEHTDGEGRFTFTVCPGEWLVLLHEEIELANWPVLRLSEGALASIYVELKSGQTIDLGEIGYEARGGFVRGIVFFDEDGTGMPENNPRLVGVRVSLVNPAKNEVIDTLTDAQGAYYFDSPEPAVYLLRFEPTVDAAESGLGEGLLGLPADEDLPPPFFLGPGQEVTHDIGYVALGSTVHGIVFFDKDGSGRRSGNEPGIPGVPVVLANGDRSIVRTAYTDQGGEYWIEGISPGTYTLRFINVYAPSENINEAVDRFRSEYGDEFTLTTAPTQQITVKAGETAEAKPTGYQPEVHEIRGRAIFEDGTPVPGLVVTLTDAEGNEDTAVTDDQGYYVFKDRRGTFTLTFPDLPFADQLLTPRTRRVEVSSISGVPDAVYRLGAGEDSRGAIGVPARGSIPEAVDDIAAYMPTSQEVAGPVARPRPYGVPGIPFSLEQIVDGAMMEVVGRKVIRDDPKAFRESLDRAFVIERVNDKRKIRWVPRVYVVQTELGGAITGAQASLYRRAKAALDDALPLLDGLEPLTPSPDEQEIEAIRAIVRTEFTELVNELGLEGGPRPRRVDDIFSLLVDRLGRLEQTFGLDPDNVITVDEEQNLTDFLVIQDYVIGLQTTWEKFRDQFAGTKFLGTQLVLLERALSSVSESVEETYRVMDSVFLGPAERQTVRIEFTQPLPGESEPPPPMFVEELLSWVSRFATVEGPTLIQDGGKRGVEAIGEIGDLLQQLVLAASEADVPHVGFSRKRVRRSLRDLHTQIRLVKDLADELLSQGEADRT